MEDFPAHLKAFGKNGYTLIELMIVMAVMALLAGVGWLGFRNYEYSAQLSNAQRDLINRLQAARDEALSGVLASGSSTHFAQILPSRTYTVDGHSLVVGQNVVISAVSPAGAAVNIYFFHPSELKEEHSDPASCPDSCHDGVTCHFACQGLSPVSDEIVIALQHERTGLRRCVKIEGSGMRVNRINEDDCL